MTQPRVRYGIYTTSDHTHWTGPMRLYTEIEAGATVTAIAQAALDEFDLAMERPTFRFHDGLGHHAVATAHIVSVQLEIQDADGNVLEQGRGR